MRFLVVYEGESVATATIQAVSQDAALLRVVAAFLTAHAPVEQMRRCPACDTLFVRVGRKQYCSRACVNRVSTRRWRESAAHRALDKQRARRRYAATKARNGQEG